jgi:hypothetical protein
VSGAFHSALMQSAAVNGVDDTHTGTVTELIDKLITDRRDLQFALTGGATQQFAAYETKPLPYAIERELRWILFRADCISIGLLKALHAGFEQEKMMSYAQQTDDFFKEIRKVKSKVKKNIKKNAQDEQLSSGMPIPDPTPTPPNLTDSADEPCGLDPNYRHRDLCPDAQDAFWFFESMKRNGFMAGGIVNLNRRMYLAGGMAKQIAMMRMVRCCQYRYCSRITEPSHVPGLMRS